MTSDEWSEEDYNVWCEIDKSPVNQIGESQEGLSELGIEPNTEIMQGDAGGEPRPKTLQVMGAFAFQPKGD